MADLRASVPLDQRLRVTEIVDGAFQRFRASPRVVATVVVIAVAPVVFVSGALNPQGVGSRPSFMSMIVISRPRIDDLDAMLVALLHNGVMLPLAAAALLVLATRTREGRPVDLSTARRAVRQFGPRMLAVWWLHLLLYAVVAAPLILGVALDVGALTAIGVIFGVAGIALVPMLSLSMPLVVLEGLGPVHAIRRSLRLTSRRFFGVAFVVGSSTLMLLLLSVPLMTVTGALADARFSFRWAAAGLADIAVALLQVPVTVFVALLLTIDTRARTEAADLRERARLKVGSGGRGPEGPVG